MEPLIGWACVKEFASLAPLTLDALRRGFLSPDCIFALKAAEQWMKAAGYMQHGGVVVLAHASRGRGR